MILLGDAGGYLDACTGEGISLALAQASSLEHTVAPLLRNREKPRAEALEAFARACREITRPYYRSTRLLLFLNRQPAWFERFVSIFRANPDLMQHFLSAQMGQAPLWPGWRKAARLVEALVVGAR